MNSQERFNLMINAMMDEYDVWSEVEILNEIDAMPEEHDEDTDELVSYREDVEWMRGGM